MDELTSQPSPYPRPTDLPTVDLLAELTTVRRKLRAANKERGRASLTLHLTRLELQSARSKAKSAGEDVENQSRYASQLYHMVREIIETVQPGYPHGIDLDTDYKWLIGELYRLRTMASMTRELRDD